MKTLIILRGVSGCGKSTVADYIKEITNPNIETLHYEADMFFYDEKGQYSFDASQLPSAHKWCRDSVMVAMDANIGQIIVSNTFTTEWELKHYLELAEEYGYNAFSLVVENRHGNKDIHDVPEKTRELQAQRLMNNIKLK